MRMRGFPSKMFFFGKKMHHFRVQWGILEEKLHFLLVKWGIFEEIKHDLGVNAYFPREKVRFLS